MTTPKFYTKRGLLTIYSYTCGYIDIKELDIVNRATLELDCIWHVKGFKNGIRFWEVFERSELKAARKFYNKCLKNKG